LLEEAYKQCKDDFEDPKDMKGKALVLLVKEVKDP